MELDDLKKSWNALDEHLKGKEFIKEEEMKQLLGRTRNNINSIERFNRKLRFAAIGILALAVIFLMMHLRTFIIGSPSSCASRPFAGICIPPIT